MRNMDEKTVPPEDDNRNIGWLDAGVILVYLVFVVIIGIWVRYFKIDYLEVHVYCINNAYNYIVYILSTLSGMRATYVGINP